MEQGGGKRLGEREGGPPRHMPDEGAMWRHKCPEYDDVNTCGSSDTALVPQGASIAGAAWGLRRLLLNYFLRLCANLQLPQKDTWGENFSILEESNPLQLGLEWRLC